MSSQNAGPPSSLGSDPLGIGNLKNPANPSDNQTPPDEPQGPLGPGPLKNPANPPDNQTPPPPPTDQPPATGFLVTNGEVTEFVGDTKTFQYTVQTDTANDQKEIAAEWPTDQAASLQVKDASGNTKYSALGEVDPQTGIVTYTTTAMGPNGPITTVTSADPKTGIVTVKESGPDGTTIAQYDGNEAKVDPAQSPGPSATPADGGPTPSPGPSATPADGGPTPSPGPSATPADGGDGGD